MNDKYTAEHFSELLNDLCSACSMIGYATSGNERQNHRATKDKIKAEIIDAVAALLRERESAAVEPYCYTVEQKNGLSQGAMCRTITECESSPLFDPENDHIIPLYRAPLASARVPDGWQLVPIEATKEMIVAGDNSGFQTYNGTWVVFPDACYKAMLAAAPKPEKE